MLGKAYGYLALLSLAALWLAGVGNGYAGTESEAAFDKKLLKEHVLSLNTLRQPWRFPEIEDRVYRRDEGVVAGHLESLMAFATVRLPRLESEGKPESPFDTLRISRDDISIILLDGKPFPDKPPLLSVEEDSVLLSGGEVVNGIVTIREETVHIAGRGIPAAEVELIYLAAPGRNEATAVACWVGTVAYHTSSIFSGREDTTTAKLRLALSEHPHSTYIGPGIRPELVLDGW